MKDVRVSQMPSSEEKVALLKCQLAGLRQRLYPLDAAVASLRWSYERCVVLKDRAVSDYEQQEKIDSLIARFCRMKEVLFPVIFVLSDKPASAVSDTVHARINYARQQGIVSGASDLIWIYEFCNSIKTQLPVRTFQQKRDDILALTPVLLAIPDQIKRYLSLFLAGQSKLQHNMCKTKPFVAKMTLTAHQVEKKMTEKTTEKTTEKNSADAAVADDSRSVNSRQALSQQESTEVVAKKVIDFHIDFSENMISLLGLQSHHGAQRPYQPTTKTK